MAPRREPLGELPLAKYIVVDESAAASSSGLKRGPSPSALLSPPKRRMLAVEGLFPSSAHLKTTPTQRSTPSTSRSSSVSSSSEGVDRPDSNPFAPSRGQVPPGSSSRSSSSSSSSSLSISAVRSPSKLHISHSRLSPSPPHSPTIVTTAPPPLPESPKPVHITREIPLVRPSPLKRLRSEGSSSSAPSSLKVPTTKRRSIVREAPPAPISMEEDGIEDEFDDKENVPPKKKKPVRESLTPKAARSKEEEMRARRMILEAEVDMPDVY